QIGRVIGHREESYQARDAQIWHCCPAQTRSAYVYPGKATEIAPNKLREEAFEWVSHEVIFSDILEVKLADGTRVRGCFALRYRCTGYLKRLFVK
ncbi:MAG TPA: hypothetical protein VF844_06715, partial [Ktedonobacteraceae bacterium]